MLSATVIPIMLADRVKGTQRGFFFPFLLFSPLGLLLLLVSHRSPPSLSLFFLCLYLSLSLSLYLFLYTSSRFAEEKL